MIEEKAPPLPVQTDMFGSLTNGTSLVESYTNRLTNGSGRRNPSLTNGSGRTQVSQTVVAELRSLTNGSVRTQVSQSVSQTNSILVSYGF
jgi:hypothetical protein